MNEFILLHLSPEGEPYLIRKDLILSALGRKVGETRIMHRQIKSTDEDILADMVTVKESVSEIMRKLNGPVLRSMVL